MNLYQGHLNGAGYNILNLVHPDYIIASDLHGSGDEGYWTSYYETKTISYDSFSPIDVFCEDAYFITPSGSYGADQYLLLQKNLTNQTNHILIYIRSTNNDSFEEQSFYCFDSDDGSLIWQSQESEISDEKINCSSVASVNNEDHYVIYFKDNQFEIRDTDTGNIALSQIVDISPVDILRSSNSGLHFICREDDSLTMEIYGLSDEISVSSNENNLPVHVSSVSHYPNPIYTLKQTRAHITTIAYAIDRDSYSSAKIEIFNIKGQLVRTLDLERDNPISEVYWDGKGDSGNGLASGLYYYQLVVDGSVEAVNKCVLLK